MTTRIENLLKTIEKTYGEKMTAVEQIKLTAQRLDELHAVNRTIAAMVRSIRFSRWDSVNGTYRNLKYHLATHLHFGLCRLAVKESKEAIDRLYSTIGNGFVSGSTLRRESRQGGWGRRGSEERERRLSFTDSRLAVTMPMLPILECQQILTSRWNGELANLADIWNSCSAWLNRFPQSSIGQRLADQLDQIDGIIPSYMAVKKYLPIGGRNAYSVLMASVDGKHNNRLANEHAIAGWHYDVTNSLRWALHQLHNSPEKTGKAPSHKAGLDILSSARNWTNNAYNPAKPPSNADNSSTAWNGRLTACRRMVDTSKIWACTVGTMQTLSPQLVKTIQLKQSELEKNRRLVFAIMGIQDRQAYQGNVLTAFTGRPIRLGNDVYAAESIWVNNIGKTETGFTFLRSSWPDSVHQNDCHLIVNGETIKPYRDGEPITNENGEPLNIVTLAEFVNSSTNWPIIIAKVETACEYYFKRRAEEKLRKLSFNQRRAHIVKAIRRLPSVEFVTSLQAGNCDVGTRQFMAQLGIDLNCQSIEGKQLAKLWYKANYPQQDRLYGTIQRQAIRLQSEMAVNHAQ